MKIRKIILSFELFGTLIFCGCSNTDDLLSPNNQYEVKEPVEIELSANNRNVVSVVTTRAALLDGADMDIPDIGIFGLARTTQDINRAPSLTTWFGPSDNWSECILDNVKANKVGTDIKWDDASATYFYPITQFYSYDFYGYYPYQPTEDLRYEDKMVAVRYTIDGTQDLLWGRATSAEQYAYSASYFRSSSAASAVRPNIPLNHMLTRFVFSVVPGESYEGSGDYSMAALMEIDTLQIVDAYTNLEVAIANLDDLNMLIRDRIYSYDGIQDTLTLCSADVDGNKIPLVPIHMEAPEPGEAPVAKQLGESIMLLPQSQYTVRIVVKMDGYHDDVADIDVPEQFFYSEVPLRLEVADNPQGVSYNVKITVNGPRDVKLSSTLVPWDVQEGPAIEL